MSHSRTRPASSRSEFVIVPFGLASEITLAVMSGGYCNDLNTVGRHSDGSPMMTPPIGASLIKKYSSYRTKQKKVPTP